MTNDELNVVLDAALPPWRASGPTIWRPHNPDDPTDFSGEAVAYVPTLNDEFDAPDARAIVVAVNLAPRWQRVAEAARRHHRMHPCGYCGDNMDGSIVMCDLAAALAALDAAREAL